MILFKHIISLFVHVEVNKIHRVCKKSKYRHKKIMCGMVSLSMILKFFLTFGRLEPCDSYKLYSYKKEPVFSSLESISDNSNFKKIHNIKIFENAVFKSPYTT